MSITKLGNVGIGTSSPTSSLETVASVPVVAQFAASVPSDSLVRFSESSTNWDIGVAGACNSQKIPKGSFYLRCSSVCTNPAALVVNSSGHLGIGTNSVPTTLAVNGSLSAKLIGVAGSTTVGSYTMKSTDFAVLANANILPTGLTTFTINLPASKTAKGMIIFVKKIDSSANTLTILAKSPDKIEGGASLALTKQYDSRRLISNGSGTWYVEGNAQCGNFVS